MKRGQRISCVYSNGKAYAGKVENLIAGKTDNSRIVVVALDGGGYRSLYENKMVAKA